MGGAGEGVGPAGRRPGRGVPFFYKLLSTSLLSSCLQVKREKGIYHTLNKLSVDVTRKVGQGAVDTWWVATQPHPHPVLPRCWWRRPGSQPHPTHPRTPTHPPTTPPPTPPGTGTGGGGLGPRGRQGAGAGGAAPGGHPRRLDRGHRLPAHAHLRAPPHLLRGGEEDLGVPGDCGGLWWVGGVGAAWVLARWLAGWSAGRVRGWVGGDR